MTHAREYPPIHRIALANVVLTAAEADDPTPEQTAWFSRILNAMGEVDMTVEWGETLDGVVYERLEDLGLLDDMVAAVWVKELRGVPERWATERAEHMAAFLGKLSAPVDTVLLEGMRRAGAVLLANAMQAPDDFPEAA